MKYHCLGSHGMGDIMMYLNIVHTKAYLQDESCTLHVYWKESPEELYYFEDPETSWEKMDYIHNFYQDRDRVSVVHHFNVDPSCTVYTYLSKCKIEAHDNFINQHIPEDSVWADSMCTRVWMMDESRFQPEQSNKVVFWRPTFNAEVPRRWKLYVSHEAYDQAREKFESLGYTVIELTYRTPIREALYHCSTAKYAYFYDGMWSMIMTMLWKPSMVTGGSTIAMYNSVASVFTRSDNELITVIDNWNTPQSWCRRQSNNHPTGPGKKFKRFSFDNCTGQEFLVNYRNRMRRIFDKAVELKVDWTYFQVLFNRREAIRKMGKDAWDW